MDAPSTPLSPASTPSSIAESRVSSRIAQGPSLITLGFLVAATWLVGRGLAESLPGNLVGYDAAIGWVVYLGAFLSQFLCVCGATVAISIASNLVALRSVGWFVPTAALLSAGIQATYALFSAQPHEPGLNAYLQTALAVFAYLSLLSASVVSLKQRASRAVALICLAITLAVGTLLSAKVLAHVASDDADGTLFFSAQSLTSVSLFLRAGVALSIYAWWLLRGSLWVKIAAGLVVLLASALWVGENGDGVAPVLLFTLQQLGSDPAPLLSDTPEALLELLIFTAALIPLFATVSPTTASPITASPTTASKAAYSQDPAISLTGRAAVTLGLLASVVPDEPLGGLVITLAALALLQSSSPLPLSAPSAGSLHAQV